MLSKEKLIELKRLYDGLLAGDFNVCEATVSSALVRLRECSSADDEIVISKKDLEFWGPFIIEHTVSEARGVHGEGFDQDSMIRPADPAELEKLLAPLAALFTKLG